MEETKRCPFCGEEILAVAIKCKHCLSYLNREVPRPPEPEVLIPCPFCGEQIPRQARHCPHCDSTLATTPPPVVSPYQRVRSYTPGERFARFDFWALILAALFVISLFMEWIRRYTGMEVLKRIDIPEGIMSVFIFLAFIMGILYFVGMTNMSRTLHVFRGIFALLISIPNIIFIIVLLDEMSGYSEKAGIILALISVLGLFISGLFTIILAATKIPAKNHPAAGGTTRPAVSSAPPGSQDSDEMDFMNLKE